MTTDTRRMARATDPRTSVAAAEAAAPKAASIRARVLEIVKRHPGASAMEIGTRYAHDWAGSLSQESHWGFRRVQRRLSDLVRDGHIEVTGSKRHGKLAYSTYRVVDNPQPPKARAVEHAWCSHCRHEVDFPPEGQLGMRL